MFTAPHKPEPVAVARTLSPALASAGVTVKPVIVAADTGAALATVKLNASSRKGNRRKRCDIISSMSFAESVPATRYG
jgi:hypothetical protein